MASGWLLEGLNIPLVCAYTVLSVGCQTVDYVYVPRLVAYTSTTLIDLPGAMYDSTTSKGIVVAYGLLAASFVAHVIEH